MDRWCFDCDLRCTQGHLVCDKVNTANLKWCDFHYEVRALRKAMSRFQLQVETGGHGNYAAFLS